MGGGAEIKDLNPWKDMIKDQLVPILSGVLGKDGTGTMPQYPGQINAGSNPMLDSAQQYAQMMAQQGGPAAWGATGNFIQGGGLSDRMAQGLYANSRTPITNPYDQYLNATMGRLGGPLGTEDVISSIVGGSVWGNSRNTNPLVDQFIGTYLGGGGYPTGWNPYAQGGQGPSQTGAPPPQGQ